MNTIRNYLENMFANLPKTARVIDLKNNILTNMEEKYNELKSMGRSENEAIGIVISEFGNIEELVSELGIKNENGTLTEPIVSSDETKAYLKAKKKMGIHIGIGVILCLLAPAVLILISNKLIFEMVNMDISYDNAEVIGVIALFILITIAVGIFIFTVMNFERYKYMEYGVQLNVNIAAELKQQYKRYTPIFLLKLIIGVCLIILSPISIFIATLIDIVPDDLGVVFLFPIIAIGTFFIINMATVKESYERLLQIGYYKRKKKKEDRIIRAVAVIVWPMSVIIYLISGFVYDTWHFNWIVFPITGIFFGIFIAAYNILTNNK